MRRTITILALCGLISAGCAFGGYSRADLHKTQPIFSSSVNKAQIIEKLGPPDKYIQLDNTEYLSYKTKSGWFVLLFGLTTAKDYEVKLTDGQFTSARMVSTGSSWGFLAPQGAVAQ